MSGKEILVDTNIFLYLLKGNDTLEKMLQGKTIFISFITELELIGFKAMRVGEEKKIHSLLRECMIVPLNDDIRKKYVEVTKTYNLKLADALIAATAMAFNIPLITADKQFKNVNELSLVAYEI